MTVHVLDVASYQGSLSAADARRAGFGAVNLKVSHGLSRRSVHPDITGWVDQVRALGLGVSTFHYLTADAPGSAQAGYAYARIAELGLLYGTAHQCDVESSPAPTLTVVRDYLSTMSSLLGRPVAVYTGDWWWAARPGWDVSDLSPYLWAAPDVGYLSGYPGDTSPSWRVGYGGWTQLSIMQYAVGPLTFPGGGTGRIDVSKSAIRDPAVWRNLTLGRPGMSYAPDSLKAARALYISLLRRAGYTIDPLAVGIVGDDAHANSGTSYHLGKDALRSTSYSVVESSRDSRPTNAAMALDLGKFRITVKGRVYDLPHFSRWLVAQCQANTPDTRDIREVIYSPDGDVVKRWDRLGKRSSGDISHLEHTHESWFRDSEGRDKTAHLTRYFTEIGLLEEPDMPISSDDVRTFATADVWPAPAVLGIADGTLSLQDFLVRIFNRAEAANNAVAQLRTAFAAFVTAEQGDDAAKADALAQLRAGIDAVPASVIDGLGGSGQSDAEIADALRAALGARAAAIGAVLAGK